MTALNHSTNSALATEAVAALGLGPSESESKKERKKRKKKEKHEHRLEAAQPGIDAAAEPAPEPQQAPPQMRLQTWLKAVSQGLESDRVVTAQKSNFLIAINCLMLSIAAHSIYRDFEFSPLQWALLPLALTNVLSLAFAVFAAQFRLQPTALEELWAMPSDEYEPAVAARLQDKQRVYADLNTDLRVLGADLSKRHRHLRTGYNVLLGGVALSTCLFVVCIAAGTRG